MPNARLGKYSPAISVANVDNIAPCKTAKKSLKTMGKKIDLGSRFHMRKRKYELLIYSKRLLQVPWSFVIQQRVASPELEGHPLFKTPWNQNIFSLIQIDWINYIDQISDSNMRVFPNVFFTQCCVDSEKFSREQGWDTSRGLNDAIHKQITPRRAA